MTQLLRRDILGTCPGFDFLRPSVWFWGGQNLSQVGRKHSLESLRRCQNIHHIVRASEDLFLVQFGSYYLFCLFSRLGKRVALHFLPVYMRNSDSFAPAIGLVAEAF